VVNLLYELVIGLFRLFTSTSITEIKILHV